MVDDHVWLLVTQGYDTQGNHEGEGKEGPPEGVIGHSLDKYVHCIHLGTSQPEYVHTTHSENGEGECWCLESLPKREPRRATPASKDTTEARYVRTAYRSNNMNTRNTK